MAADSDDIDQEDEQRKKRKEARDKKAAGIQRVYKGLHTDFSYHDQPDGAATFVLNGVNETEEGDMNFISNEQSNRAHGFIKSGYTIVGRVYMTNNETAIFSRRDDLILGGKQCCEIGIYNDKTGSYVPHVNAQLGFQLNHQVQATFRLRRGCERVVYFTAPKPMIYNFDKPNNFRKYATITRKKAVSESCDCRTDEPGVCEGWDIEKFSLFKTYNSVPQFDKIEITGSGQLKPGSYNFAVQYLDEDLNPTEWITVTDTVIIYNDNYYRSFEQIRGSTNLKNAYQNFQPTNKGVELILSNMDTNYPFYRIAAICANSGTGLINEVLYSPEKSVYDTTFHYGGETQGWVKGTIEEVQGFNNIITSAEHITQLDNILVLGKTKSKNVDYCALQQYASRIKSELVTKQITLNRIDQAGNPKRGEVHTENSMGYMPGEIYSFGIVYVFEDGSTTPAYHIPGKKPGDSTNMGNIDPVVNSSDKYMANAGCDGDPGNYWGVDYMGRPLAEQPIRHHRFPFRHERDIGEIPLVTKGAATGGKIYSNTIVVNLLFTVSRNTGTDSDASKNASVQRVNFRLTYRTSLVSKDEDFEVPVSGYGTLINFSKTFFNIPGRLISSSVARTGYSPVNPFNETAIINGPYTTKASSSESDTSDTIYTTHIMGIKFTNIDQPLKSVTKSNDEVIGYYIVRNERTEENKTILDTGVMTPLVRESSDHGKNFFFAAHGFLLPYYSGIPSDPWHQEDSSWGTRNAKIEGNAYAVIHPEFKFNKKEYLINADMIAMTGVYGRTRTLSASSRDEHEFRSGPVVYHEVTQDVAPGTSHTDQDNERDDDGFDLRIHIKDNDMVWNVCNPGRLEHSGIYKTNRDEKSQIKDAFYLDALFSKTLKENGTGNRFDVYNLSSDNRIGIVQFEGAYPNYAFPVMSTNNDLPHIIMSRRLNSVYANFRVLPYYKEHVNIKGFINNPDPPHRTSGEIFNGDSYIGSMRYVSSMFYRVRMKERDRSVSWKERIWQGVQIIGGAALILTGVGAGAGVALIGLGVAGIISGIKKEQANKVYQELYEKGLVETVSDDFTGHYLWHQNASDMGDDEIQWVADILTPLWFETGVNINWRMGSNTGITDFLDSPASDSQDDTKRYMVDKLTNNDNRKKGGKAYSGVVKAEIYDINPDYKRREREKVFEHLGLEYSCACATSCAESFPHRIAYSQQSFQEELTDNFRVFLPNNYKDIEGMTGTITNLFTMKNNLYVHTEEGLWHLPQQMQERVTNDVVSFIGTGSYFTIPPRRIVDDATGNSAGTIHKWATVKTPHGVFFVAEKQREIYHFNGESLRSLNKGMNSWLKDNIPMTQGYGYNNPHAADGMGFLAAYDSRKERILFTKIEKRYDFISTAILDNSWTLGYSIKIDNWLSFYDYRPNVYLSSPSEFYSWKHVSADKVNNIWIHNVPYRYQNFYGENKPFIVEYVSVSNPLITRIWDGIKIISQAKQIQFGPNNRHTNENNIIELKDVFFNKAIFYNSRQCTGMLNLVPKSLHMDSSAYLLFQTKNEAGSVIVKRNETDWEINELRDIRSSSSVPMFTESLRAKHYSGVTHYIDKLVNTSGLNPNKDWMQMESFRDKFLVCRFIFDKFEFNDVPNFNNNIKLILNYTLDTEYPSFR